MEITLERTLQTQPYENTKLTITVNDGDIPEGYAPKFDRPTRLVLYAQGQVADWEATVRGHTSKAADKRMLRLCEYYVDADRFENDLHTPSHAELMTQAEEIVEEGVSTLDALRELAAHERARDEEEFARTGKVTGEMAHELR